LEYEVTKDDEIEKEISIRVPSADLTRYVDAEIDKVQKQLTLKGFRKGKVPKSIIKTRYYDSIKAQALNSLVSESLANIITEKDWSLASQAKLLNVDEGEHITFKMQLEVIPHFSVGEYTDVELFKEERLPDDYLLEQALRDVRERSAQIGEVNRAAVVDDFVTLELTVTEGGKVKTQGKDVTVRIGDRSLPDEINRALVGAQVSDKKEVTSDTTTYAFTVKKIEEKVLPQIDNDFAKSLKFENVEELKKKLMEEARKNEEKRIEAELKESLSKILLERTVFKVPASFVENEYKKMLQNANLPDSESNKERFWKVAEDRVRLNLILDRIAEQESISVNEDEIIQLVSAMGMKLNNENRQNVIGYVGNIMTREKTVDFLFKKATISEKSRIISPKEAMNDSRSVRH
jgi:trigger factor